MIDHNLIISKAGLVKKHLRRVKEKHGDSFEAFLEDLDRQDIIAFNLHTAIQNCVDIAAHIIAEEGLGVPGNVNEMFYLLEENGYLPAVVTKNMVKAVGFRNLLVHEYAKIDLKKVYDITQHYLQDLNDYLAAVFTKLNIQC